jgi:hypothetical protein
VVVVNIELAAPNDCAMPEPGVCPESTGDGSSKGTAVSSDDSQREQVGNFIGFL